MNNFHITGHISPKEDGDHYEPELAGNVQQEPPLVDPTSQLDKH